MENNYIFKKNAPHFLVPTVFKILLAGSETCMMNVKSVKGPLVQTSAGVLTAADCLESSVIVYTEYTVIQCFISLFSFFVC